MTFRFAVKEDISLILTLIKELADYEGMLSEVIATEELLEEWLFEKQKAEVLIGEIDGNPIGFALFFHNFSTFLGRAGIYLEDLYVRPAYRGHGFGKAFLKAGCNCCGKRLRTFRMVVSGYESTQHRVLPGYGGGTNAGLDCLSYRRNEINRNGE